MPVDPIEGPVDRRVVEVFEERGDFRKDILAEKHEARARPSCRRQRRQAENRRIGQRDDDVLRADLTRCRQSRHEEGEVVRCAADESPPGEQRAVRSKNPDAFPFLPRDRPERCLRLPATMQRASGYDRDRAAIIGREILRELGQELSGRRLIGPVRTIEETNVHADAAAAFRRSALYHSIVRTRPLRKSVVAEKPNVRALDTSRLLRGWPSGLVRSNTSRPRKPLSSPISSARSRMLISNPAPRLTGSG